MSLLRRYTGSEQTPSSRAAVVVGHIESALLVLILAAMVVVAAAQILLRNVFGGGIAWAEPALRVLVLWIGMVGALAATRDDSQLTVDVVSRLLPDRWRLRTRVVTDLVTAIVSGLVAWYAGRLVASDREAELIAFGIVPVWVCELVLPVAFGLICLRYALFAIEHGIRSRRQESSP